MGDRQDSGNLFGGAETVSLEWLLFDFGGRKNITGAARKPSTVSNIAFTGANQQVIYVVSMAYYAYAAALQRHRKAAEALANAKEDEAAADVRYRHGEGTVIETAQSRGFTAQAQLSVVNTQGADEQAYTGLLAAMGVSPLDSYKQGVGTVTAAVEAETHLFEARLAEADAYISALSAAATLAYAAGQLGSAPR